MYGYSRSAGPSVASMAAQASWTTKAISHCIQLSGSRSTRAAISPRTTTAVPPAVPEVSCAIYLSPCCHPVSEDDGKGGGWALGPVSRTENLDWPGDVEDAGSTTDDAGQHEVGRGRVRRGPTRR